MKVEQRLYRPEAGWSLAQGSLEGRPAALVLAFGDRAALTASGLADLRGHYPGAHLMLCSTAGEICDTQVTEGALTTTAVAFDHTTLRFASTPITRSEDSLACGQEIARQLAGPGLVHVFVICDGTRTNGTEFVRGLLGGLPPEVKITGGLAGDGARFERTIVGLDEVPSDGRIVAVGFCGARLKVSFGCEGGWAPFGPERIVTRSQGNQLFELDGRSALALYKTYLGDLAAGLPGTGLRFPLQLTPLDGAAPVVRTILSVNDTDESMTFAGDIPVGARVRFMRASHEDLIDGAARASSEVRGSEAELVLCVSCIGRRIVLGQRIEEETELLREAVGARPVIAGFYSYGELAPRGTGSCQLHNQTMTITTLSEL